MSDTTFDYIVVGAGSAGCVMASRLTEDPESRVLLVEAGPRGNSLLINMPGALFLNFAGGSYNWRFESEPQPGLDGRRMYHPRGRVLGGTSAINGMVYMRGHPLDFDDWADTGCPGWGYADVLPYFKRSERHDAETDSRYRGHAGELCTTRATIWSPLQEAFLQAGAAIGHPFTGDPNGFRQEGFLHYDMTIEDGVRASTAHAFLRPTKSRKNLRIATSCRVLRVDIERDRAGGIFLADNAKIPRRIMASRAVVLCAGAVQSPQLLMLSGIGPADHIRSIGIECVHDLPGVGKNLNDHLEIHLVYESKERAAYNRHLRPDRAAAAALRWCLFKDGIAGTTGYEVGAMLATDPSFDRPDLQVHFYPVLLKGWRPDLRDHGFSIGLNQNRVYGTGEVRLASNDPYQPAAIDNRYLSTYAEMQSFLGMVDIGREIAEQQAFDRFRGKRLAPTGNLENADELKRYVRTTCNSAYHLAGTCRMGRGDMAVVNPDCQVVGIKGLYVVDASVMPRVTNANTNAPTIMIAEKISDALRGRAPLAPEHPPIFTAQR